MTEKSESVFSGRLVRMHDPIPLGATVAPKDLVLDYAFEVSKIWKGSPADTIWVRAYRETKYNSHNLAVEQDYIVYGFLHEERLWTDPCTRTKMTRLGTEDLYWLGEASVDNLDGRTPSMTMDSLIEQLETGNTATRKQAFLTLVGIRGEEDLVISVLVDRFEKAATHEKIQIVDALALMEDRGAPALPWLLKATELPDSQLRNALAKAFGDIGIANKEIFGGLVSILSDPNRRARNSAATSFASLSKRKEDAAWETLRPALTASDDHQRLGGYETLRLSLLGLPQVETSLLGGLTDPQSEVRLAAARALAVRPSLKPETLATIKSAKDSEESKPAERRNENLIRELSRSLHTAEVGSPEQTKP
ncbi:MAG: hypothetical protein HKN21_05405 [Candidatus Eisenbacteria bacterium]|uniref:HEAT repeat domain-containing protein n=1 Tax=Eiseniibacteriota bacterium TaxID=2212470 RepID=A0A7Y2E845_UNCEI|nr:hypothetical protein [Candidatus Eisenbacteria bacterium]